MGEDGDCAQHTGLLPNGILTDRLANVTRVLNVERWSEAERRTAELIAHIQPSRPSEEHRNAVASYVRLLIEKCFPCQVFTFGSVPLKTYLLDGDIDLTACSDNENLKDTWVNAVREVLENEEKNKNAEFHIREVQYIQAEVKIIKCLVDNIVVDISFNQVGGLCTLCFLEEVDDLINQNHLFKRSIILIKAWCYYESRILGAHHGLISTYALEILVLYIFHLFNNSFAGPLEVLYRFLEFFSNFDWDNFCVSLWGPVPMRSLPDMIAERPRKDTGKLFLSDSFLHGCNKRYSAIPRELESQAQPFTSKHFNVVDPLRTNNNLGRSVSKGNFFRIRSAFAFGAKRLARLLLDCPLDSIIAEVNQFFMNTWERHGGGHRPDIPSLNLWHVQLVSNVPIEEVNSKNTTNVGKNSENAPIDLSHDHVLLSVHDQDSKLQIQDATRENHQKKLGTSNTNSSLVLNSHKKYSSGQANSRVFHQSEGNTASNGVHSVTRQKMLKPIKSLVEEGQDRFQFTRTRSTPELAQAAPGFSKGRRTSTMENRKTEDPSSWIGIDFCSRKNNSTSTPMRQSSSNKSLEGASDTNITSKGYNNLYHDFGFRTVGEELSSIAKVLDMQQEEQDLINMMDSPNIQMLTGQNYPPIHVPSQFPLALSPVPSQIGVSHGSWTGVYPTTLSLPGPSCESNMQAAPGLVSAPLSHHFHNAMLRSSHNDAVEFVNEVSLSMKRNTTDGDQSIWCGNDVGISRSCNVDNSNQLLHDGSKQQKSHCGFNPIQTLRTADSGASLQGQNKFGREGRHSVLEDGRDLFQNQKGGGTEYSSNFRCANIRSLQASQASSCMSISEEEKFSNEKVPKLVRDKLERKPVFHSSFGRSMGGSSQFEISSNLPDGDDDITSWALLSSEETYMAERVTGSSISISGTMSGQLYSLEPAQVMGPNRLIPFTQGTGDNHNVLPVTFFPTGPPFPFVMVPVPIYGSTSASHFGSSDEMDHGGASPSDGHMDTVECFDHADIFLSLPASVMSEPESSDEHKHDILNSDRNSHWQNLEYGWSCQNSLRDGHFPFLLPPIHLQGQIPSDDGGRSISANQNLTQIIGYGPHLVPMIPLQSRSDGASSGFQRYGEEAPRFRGGTGTYLPNPKGSSPRQRQSNLRNGRWNYNSGRHDSGDREESWINRKQRPSGRGQAHNESQRSNSRPEKIRNHKDEQWSSSYHVENNSFGPTNSSHDSGVVVLAFGSLGPVQLSKDHGAVPIANGVPGTGMHKQRHGAYRGGSQRPSLTQPTPPPLKRKC